MENLSNSVNTVNTGVNDGLNKTVIIQHGTPAKQYVIPADLPKQGENVSSVNTYGDKKAAAATRTANERTITMYQRNPQRCVSINIDAEPWQAIERDVPEQYRVLLAAVYDSAAETILRDHVAALQAIPLTIASSMFSHDAIIAQASGANSTWLNKEELTQAWLTSATRARFVSHPNYAANKEFRAAVNALADNYLRLSGKTSQYQAHELDAMMARLHTDDLDTPMGDFIVRRIEQIKNKPQRAGVDMSLLDL